MTKQLSETALKNMPNNICLIFVRNLETSDKPLAIVF